MPKLVHLLCTEFMSGETFYRSLINLKTKTISSKIVYSNQSTRALTTTPLQTYIEQMPQVANVTLRSTFSLNKTKENESTEIIFSFWERMSFDQC